MKLRVIGILIFCSNLGISQCITFDDISNSNEIEEAYSIFRNHFTQNRFQEALPYWEKIYQSAPALNGRIDSIYKNGIVLFTIMLKKEPIQKNKMEIAKFILKLYSEHNSCFPNKEIKPISPEIIQLLDGDSMILN